MVKSAMRAAPANLMRLFLVVLGLIPLLSGMGCAAYQKNVEREERLFSATTPKAKIDEAMKSKIIRYRFVAVNLYMITGAEKSDQYNRTLQLNLFDDAIFRVVLDRREVRSEASFVWLGHIEGVENSQVTLAVEDGIMAGNIRIRQSFYQVRYIGEGTHVLYQIDPTAFPPDSEPVAAPSDRH
jgi:hypothetical protein